MAEKDICEEYEDSDYIFYRVGPEGLWVQLAEEAAELAQAAAKYARYLHGTNPCAGDRETLYKHVVEELTDIKLVMDILMLEMDNDVYENKLRRWIKRLKRFEKECKNGQIWS